jgi:FtsP/CotA-like multicopper oxidase with cupredoxin domain
MLGKTFRCEAGVEIWQSNEGAMNFSRRGFLKMAGAVTAGVLLPRVAERFAASGPMNPARQKGAADYSIRIGASPVEIAPQRIVSAITYNGQFPGPLLRFKEGQPVIIDIHNDSDTPEQLHWHGQTVPVDVDGSAEEGTPYIPARGQRQITFTPGPAGLRFYHTHNRAGADLSAGQYSGQVGPVYIEPKENPSRYDREVFLVLKEFEPTFSRGGDMDMDFLSPATKVKMLEEQGKSAMNASLTKGMPHGFEVGYGSFTINGRMLGHGEPVRVKQGERVLFHVLNGSATEIRSLALPGHTFRVVALDGNPVPNPAAVPVLWLGTAERISAIVEMHHPGVWILGDLADDDRHHGMGIVVEYAGSKGKAQWVAPSRSRWDYARFAKAGETAGAPDETFDMLFVKENAAEEGFNRWTINGVSFPMNRRRVPAAFHLKQGKRYRIRMRNASDDIHPIHLHRHSFELTSLAGKPCAGVFKDVVMLGGYQESAIDFVADKPGLTLFHCHQQLHMDYGFMTLFDYV